MTLDLHPAADDLVRVVGAIGDDQLTQPTPCEGLTVGDMLAHVVGLTEAFRDCAAKVKGPTTQSAPRQRAADLSADWREVIARQAEEMADAWDEPQAWEGEGTVGGVTSPAAMNGAFANDELVVHAWDLAVATGQTVQPAPANVQACYDLASSIPSDSPARQGGLFGPVVEIPDDAPLLDRALAATGRDPGWQPTS